ncbi:MAG: hypothetical protein JXQ67_01640 [Campylobacterales bacterium]|nr:hypothetical protein [Campylobacterales bacterium]
MLFFGHRFLQNESLYYISDVDAIAHTPPNATIYIKFLESNLDLIDYAKTNALPFALGVADITELLYASALGAKYILVKKELAKTAQKIAESYLMDAKILVRIEEEEEIEELAILGIDGVIFSSAIVKINS